MQRQAKTLLGLTLLLLGMGAGGCLLGMLFYVPLRELALHGPSGFGHKAFYYWLPVLMFLPPALYCGHVGWRLLRAREVGRLALLEVTLMLALAGIVLYLNQAADADYAERSRAFSGQPQAEAPP